MGCEIWKLLVDILAFIDREEMKIHFFRIFVRKAVNSHF